MGSLQEYLHINPFRSEFEKNVDPEAFKLYKQINLLVEEITGLLPRLNETHRGLPLQNFLPSPESEFTKPIFSPGELNDDMKTVNYQIKEKLDRLNVLITSYNGFQNARIKDAYQEFLKTSGQKPAGETETDFSTFRDALLNTFRSTTKNGLE